MKTLTVTQARGNLSALLSRAARGEEIGIISGEHIVALRRVNVSADDYATTEYDVSDDTLERATRKLNAAAKSNKGTPWNGTAKSLRG